MMKNAGDASRNPQARLPRCLGKEDREFVSAVAKCSIDQPQALAQAFAKLGQQFAADEVAVLVINSLKVVYDPETAG